MNSIRNRQFFARTALVLSLTLGASAAMPRRAEALAGYATANPVVFIEGALLAVASIAPFATGLAQHKSGLVGISIGILIVGVLLMDGDTQAPVLRFQELTPAQQARVGVTADEYAVYESELEEVTTSWDIATAQAFRNGAHTAAAAKPFFEAEFATLSVETRNVMAKIVRATE